MAVPTPLLSEGRVSHVREAGAILVACLDLPGRVPQAAI